MSGRPRLIGGLRVERADAVDEAGVAQDEGGHVELGLVVVHADAHLDDPLEVEPGAVDRGRCDASHHVRGEALVPGRHRRVDREDRMGTHAAHRVLERDARRDELAGLLDEHERGVALVEVPGGWLDPEGAQRTHATDAEDHLLVQAHLAAPHVEDVADRPVVLGVVGHVGVEQQERDATDLREPDGGDDGATGDLDRDEQRVALEVPDAQERQVAGLQGDVVVLLVAVRVDHLAEVAAAVEEPDGDERQRHVRGRLAVVAREDAEAARVDGQRLVQAVLGAEVRHRTVQLVAVAPSEPVAAAVAHVTVELLEHGRVRDHEVRVVEQGRPIARRRQDMDGTAEARPHLAVDAREDRTDLWVPGPVEVVRQPRQAFQLPWEPQVLRRHGRDIKDRGRQDRRMLHDRSRRRVVTGPGHAKRHGCRARKRDRAPGRWDATRRHGRPTMAGPMRVVMISSECEPFAKTGGLADVVDALSRALGSASPAGPGHDVDVYLPWYRGLEPPATPGAAASSTSASAARATEPVTIWTGQADGYRLRLVEHAPSFDREGYYMAGGLDHPDNAARFTLFGRAALEAIRVEGAPVDIVHGHDWEAGPALLALALERARTGATRPATVLTCHNLAYHGWTPRAEAWQLDLPDSIGDAWGVDVLRETVGVADIVNTVSPTYARESLTPELGLGLDAALRARGDRYGGIINGIDTELWDPATDAALAATFSAADLAGKAACRDDLCARHGLDPDGPILGVIGRLDPQKGFDLIAEATPRLLADGARLDRPRHGRPGAGRQPRRAGRGAPWDGSPSSTASIVTRRAGSTRAPTCSSCPPVSSPAARGR